MINSILAHLLTVFCVCAVTENNVQESIDASDVIVVGRAIRNVHTNNEIQEIWDKEGVGYGNVLFVVEEVLKGVIEKDTIYFNQSNAGFCTGVFPFNETLIVFGRSIKRFEFATDPYDEMPPDGVRYLSISEEVVNYHNSILGKYETFGTSQCWIFHPNFKLGKAIRRQFQN